MAAANRRGLLKRPRNQGSRQPATQPQVERTNPEQESDHKKMKSPQQTEQSKTQTSPKQEGPRLVKKASKSDHKDKKTFANICGNCGGQHHLMACQRPFLAPYLRYSQCFICSGFHPNFRCPLQNEGFLQRRLRYCHACREKHYGYCTQFCRNCGSKPEACTPPMTAIPTTTFTVVENQMRGNGPQQNYTPTIQSGPYVTSLQGTYVPDQYQAQGVNQDPYQAQDSTTNIYENPNLQGSGFQSSSFQGNVGVVSQPNISELTSSVNNMRLNNYGSVP